MEDFHLNFKRFEVNTKWTYFWEHLNFIKREIRTNWWNNFSSYKPVLWNDYGFQIFGSIDTVSVIDNQDIVRMDKTVSYIYSFRFWIVVSANKRFLGKKLGKIPLECLVYENECLDINTNWILNDSRIEKDQNDNYNLFTNGSRTSFEEFWSEHVAQTRTNCCEVTEQLFSTSDSFSFGT